MPKLLISLPTGDSAKDLAGDLITIGRTPDNMVQINHHSVSAHHARLHMLPTGNYKIKDLDSTNRTCVNGIPVSEAELSGSCFLRFGTIECVFKAESANSSDQLQSQVAELQRQLDSLMKARDMIAQQNQILAKERDTAKSTADTAQDSLAEARKQIEAFGSTGGVNEQQVAEISAKLIETNKKLEAMTAERDSLLEANQELTEKLAEVSRTKKGATSAVVQKKAAASVAAELDERVEDFEEEEVAHAQAGQRTVVAGSAPGRIFAGSKSTPLLSPWLNRGGANGGPKTTPISDEPTNITSMPLPTAEPPPVVAKSIPGPIPGPTLMPPPPMVKEETPESAPQAPTPKTGSMMRVIAPPPQSNGHAPAPSNAAVRIGRASANAAPQNPEIRPAWDLLNTMRRSLHYFLRHQDEMNVLQEISANAHSLTEMTKESILRPVYELSLAMENLIADLHKNPTNINASTLRTVGQSIDFLATLIDEANLSRIKDVSNARVFAIDDDEGILDTITATMEMANLQVATSFQSNAGLTKLSGENYDLILLDVGLPEMNGMDICSRVRAMPHHQKTPIVFLTGEATVQNRVQSTLNGGNDLIGKPFSVLELAVKSLTWIFKGQLGLV